jgi:hypothetical protein
MLERWDAGMHKSHPSPSANIHVKACMFLVTGQNSHKNYFFSLHVDFSSALSIFLKRDKAKRVPKYRSNLFLNLGPLA